MPRRKRRRSRRAALGTNQVILCVDSNFEPVTKAGFDYRVQHVYPYLKRKGFSVVLLQGSLARRKYVATEARNGSVQYITGVGHGTPTTYTGDYYDPIFDVGNYTMEESKGKIVHLLSCETAETLGPDFVAHGCRAYFGYDENFTFHAEHADIFFECDSSIDQAFADGLKAGEVYSHAKALYDECIARLRANGQNHLAATLEFDRDHLRCPSSGRQWGGLDEKLD